MPRNAAGTYSLPNAPVVSNTTILSNDENVTRDDMAEELSNSLDRYGRGGMLVPFKNVDGTMAAPGITWSNEPTSGFYRNGTGDFWYSISGQNVFRITANGIELAAGKYAVGVTQVLIQDDDPAATIREGEQWYEADTGMLYLRYQNPDATYTYIGLNAAAVGSLTTDDFGIAGGVPGPLDVSLQIPISQIPMNGNPGDVPGPLDGSGQIPAAQLPAGLPASEITVGNPVIGATAGAVLYADNSSNLGVSAIIYDGGVTRAPILRTNTLEIVDNSGVDFATGPCIQVQAQGPMAATESLIINLNDVSCNLSLNGSVALDQDVTTTSTPQFTGLTVNTPGGLTLAGNLTMTSGKINQYGGGVPADGDLLIGNLTNGEFDMAPLTAGTGIVVTTGPGTLEVGLDPVSSPTFANLTVSSGIDMGGDLTLNGAIREYAGSAPTDGQLLIGNTAGTTFTPATLTAGTGITITNGAGAITVAASGGGGGETASAIRNLVHNGDFTIWQRTADATISNATAKTAFADRWILAAVTGSAQINLMKEATPSLNPSDGADRRYDTAFRLLAGGADATIAAADLVYFYQVIEGYDAVPLFGRTCTLTFWVKRSSATPTGTYSVALQNSGRDRSCVMTYTLPADTNWHFQTLTFPALTAGTWAFNNGAGMYLCFCIAAGTNHHVSAAGAWETGTKFAVSAQANGVSTTSNNLYFTGICLVAGSTAPAINVPRSYGEELRICQRYYSKSYHYSYMAGGVIGSGAHVAKATGTAAGQAICNIRFPVSMRTIPTIALYSSNNGASANWYRNTGAANVAMLEQSAYTSESSTMVYNNAAVTDAETISGHWTADAEF